MKQICLFIFLALYACGKDDESQYTNLNGIELRVENLNPDVRTYTLAKSKSLDIDKDEIMDVTFTVNLAAESGHGPSYGHSSVTIEPLNGFKVDTIQRPNYEKQNFSAPRYYNQGDNILNSNTYTDGIIELTSFTYYSYAPSNVSNDIWLHVKGYIVLKKEGSPNDEYCWIKVDVTSYHSIKFFSCFYYKDMSMLKIVDPF